ncbi:hypothetical protein V6N12_065801 [Hibiscus sabdariffa]|uniref:Transposase n=1 Tax=Hibiscus sabdariffa TaxID=183260 RepID=A0ABR2G9S8_9ROSI
MKGKAQNIPTSADIYLTAVSHNRKRGKIFRPETIGSQIRVRSAQPTSANLSWAREFYAHNAEEDDTVNNIRGRRVTTNSTTINRILDLSENLPSIYDLIGALEDVDYNTIKDQLCIPGTEWKMTGKNP